jgi:hypothetical protein
VASLLKKKQRRLANLINLTLVQSYSNSNAISNANTSDEDSYLRYYQGYHDLACIFMSALGGGNPPPQRDNDTTVAPEQDDDDPLQLAMQMGLELPSRVLCQVSLSHFRDATRCNFEKLTMALRLTLFPLLQQLDPELHAHLHDCDMEPFFCLSWVLTWFSHDVRDTELVKRLFDAFLVSHPLLPVYVSIAMMLHPTNRQAILQTECDFASIHQCLAMLPRNSCRVGWKVRLGGDGYVSDEEGDDDRTASTDLDYSMASEDLNMGQTPEDCASITSDGTGMGLSSLQNVGPIGFVMDKEPVPFQGLIDTALVYMRRFPPRCLVPLSRRYFKEDLLLPDMTRLVPHISLLQPPPSWSLAATTKSDWVLKQRAREQIGLSVTSRKDRRKKNQTLPSSFDRRAVKLWKDDNVDDDDDPSTGPVDDQYLQKRNKSLAVIASGNGAGQEAERRERFKRRLWVSVVVVGIVAVGIGVAIHNDDNNKQTSGLVGMETNAASTKEDSTHGGSAAKESSQLKTLEASRSLSGEKVDTSSASKSVPPFSSILNQVSKGLPKVSLKALPTVAKVMETSSAVETASLDSTIKDAKPVATESASSVSSSFDASPNYPTAAAPGQREPGQGPKHPHITKRATTMIYRFLYKLRLRLQLVIVQPLGKLLKMDSSSQDGLSRNETSRGKGPIRFFLRKFFADTKNKNKATL